MSKGAIISLVSFTIDDSSINTFFLIFLKKFEFHNQQNRPIKRTAKATEIKLFTN